jgi:hypothetical protein
MCDPASLTLAVTAASAAASVGSGVFSIIQQDQYNDDLAAANQKQIDENAEAARKVYEQNAAAIDKATVQAQESAGREIQENQIAALKARATALTAAGEAGVSGLSVDALLADFEAQEARFEGAVKANLEGLQGQNEAAKDAALATAEGRIQSIPEFVPSPIEVPDFFGPALRVGQGVIDYKVATDPDFTL